MTLLLLLALVQPAHAAKKHEAETPEAAEAAADTAKTSLDAEIAALPNITALPPPPPGDCSSVFSLSTGQAAICSGVILSPVLYNALKANREAALTYQQFMPRLVGDYKVKAAQAEICTNLAGVEDAVRAGHRPTAFVAITVSIAVGMVAGGVGTWAAINGLSGL